MNVYTTSTLSTDVLFGHSGCFPVLVIIDNARVNTGRVHLSFLISVSVFLRQTAGTVVPGSHDSAILSYLRTLQTGFDGGGTNSHCHQQCAMVPFPAHLCQHLQFVANLVTAVLTGVRRCLVMVLICTSLMISGVEHLLKNIFTYF